MMSTTVLVREADYGTAAERGDVSAIIQLARQQLETTNLSDAEEQLLPGRMSRLGIQLSKQADPRLHACVAEIDSVLVGFATYHTADYNRRDRRWESIYVYDLYSTLTAGDTKSTVAIELLQFVAKQATALGIDQICVSTELDSEMSSGIRGPVTADGDYYLLSGKFFDALLN